MERLWDGVGFSGILGEGPADSCAFSVDVAVSSFRLVEKLRPHKKQGKVAVPPDGERFT